jgi:hypothetical protein
MEVPSTSTVSDYKPQTALGDTSRKGEQHIILKTKSSEGKLRENWWVAEQEYNKWELPSWS